jgi:GT2 family glycosyltransferase
MNNLPTVKIVIPTYNRANDLLECINSLCEAGIRQNQIIVVDNHSQDNTKVCMAKRYPEATLIALGENKGATGASNIGFEHALEQQANYVLRLDSDTIVASDFIQPLIARAEKDAKIGIVTPKIYYFDPPHEIWYAGANQHPFHFGSTQSHRHETDHPENSQAKEVDYAWGAAMLIKSDVLRATGGFDTDFFVYYEEVDFCLRAKDLGYKIVVVPESHIWHKVGSSANNAWTAFHWNRSKMLLLRKHAKNIFHRMGLIVYAFLYAFYSFARYGKNSGNRGPILPAIKGLFQGLFNQ